MNHGKEQNKNRKNRKLRYRKTLKMINPHVAGIDIAKEELWCCIPDWDTDKPVRTFGTHSSQLRDIVAWFKEYSITSVAMESTGIYWIPLYLTLIEAGLEVYLVNARSIKSVNGRPKTDKLDCQWIWRLHTYGLLRSSFLPDSDTFTLRSYTRHRDNLIQSQSREIQHMQKTLFELNINLDLVLTDIQGVTGMRILHAIADGEQDPMKLASLRDPHTKRDTQEIAAALDGQYREEEIFILGQSLELYENYQLKLKELDKVIEKFLIKKIELLRLKKPRQCNDKEKKKVVSSKRKHGKPNGQVPRFDIAAMAEEIYGVDISLVPGIGPGLMLTALAEVGTDLKCWPTHKHFTSWLGLSPCPDISGGKRLNNKTKKVVNRLSGAFRLGARTLSRSDTALGAFYRRMKARKGAAKAITAAARKIAEIFYKMVTLQKEYYELGSDYYSKRRKKRTISYIQRKASELGFELIKVQQEEDEKAS